MMWLGGVIASRSGSLIPESLIPVIIGSHPTLALSLVWRASGLPDILHESGRS